MTPRDKLVHAIKAQALYDEWTAARRAYDRTSGIYFLLVTATLLAFAALPFILYWGDLLP
jgi:hypothetical protein